MTQSPFRRVALAVAAVAPARRQLLVTALLLGGCRAGGALHSDAGSAMSMRDGASSSPQGSEDGGSARHDGGQVAAGDDGSTGTTPGDASVPVPGDDGSVPDADASLPSPQLEQGRGPEGCPDAICAADRTELPVGEADHRLSPNIVEPEPPRIERILRMSELANPECLSDCPDDAAEDAPCSDDCRGRALQPFVPAFRTSSDGRLALTGSGGAELSASRLDGLNDRPLTTRDTTLNVQAFSRSMAIDTSAAKLPGGSPKRKNSPSRFLCSEDQAPHTCGADDCYDLTLVEQWEAEGADCPNGWPSCARLVSVPITVRVQDPKTKDALVVDVHSTGDWVPSATFPAQVAEPIPTADGRLVVFRLLGGYPLSNGIGMDYSFVKNDGSVQKGRYSLSYVYSDKPCDVRAWFSTRADGSYPNLRPFSAAHYDQRLARYGFAAYPLRDPHGEPFKEGDLVRGSYPWMDRHGNNIFFSTILPVGVDDSPNGASRYPMSIEHPRLGRPTSRSPTGFAVAGSWTHGKIVMLDGVLNNEDYGVDVGDTRRFQLYRSASGIPVSVRVDGNSNTRSFPTPNTRSNSQHMESLENTHAMHTAMRPVAARDVVWTLTRGDFMQEIVFDDMIDPHVLLFAPMNASWLMSRELGASEQAFGTRRGSYQDGFSFVDKKFVHDPATIALQNAAAPSNYPIPTHGTIRGEARVEPVAQGGIEGRGLWLEPTAAAQFAFPSDTALPARSFYVSTFFDSRASLSGGRRLLSLDTSTGTALVIAHPGGFSVHRQAQNTTEVVSFPVSTSHPWRKDGWHHVGVLFANDGQVTVFIDGDPIGEHSFSAPVRLASGARVVAGGTGDGFAGARGWYDELRLVIAGEASQLEGVESVELLCNYARGTMASLSPASQGYADAEQNPHVRVRANKLGLAVTRGQRLRCVTDYTRDLAVRIPLPTGQVSLRSHILEQLSGDVTLHAGKPRPDTQSHGFCLSCHAESQTDALRPEGLGMSALAPKGIPVELDTRTQPGQPYSRWDQTALVSGVVPAHWFTSIYGVPQPASEQRLSKPHTILDWWLSE